MLVVTFLNISDMAPISDYKYSVWVTTTEGTKKTLAAGIIRHHVRDEGWEKLVQKLLDNYKT